MKSRRQTSSGVTGWVACIVLAVVAIAIGLPLWWGRVLAGQDIITYLINAQQTASNLREGVFFPAWGGGFNAGFGSPALIFYPPVTSYVHGAAVLCAVPVVSALGFLAGLAHLGSGVAAWAWLKSNSRREAALAAAIVYMVAPYRFVDLYLRSALSEHWAFVWPPLILLVAGSKTMRRGLQVPILAFLIAALLLTNIPLAMLFGLGLGAWFVVTDRVRGRRFDIAIAAVCGFGLAAFQLVPQALSSSFLDLDRFYGAAAGRYRASANTLFSAGFDEWNLNTEFSLCLVATFALLCVAYLLLPATQRRQWSVRMTLWAGIGCVVAATGPAGPIWDAMPVLSKIQFPWRVTAILTLLAAAMVARLEPRRAVTVVVVAIVLAAPFSYWDRTVPGAEFDLPRPASVSPGSVFPDPQTVWEAGGGLWHWRHRTLAEVWLVPKDTGQAFFAELAGEHPPQYDPIRQRPAVMLEDPSAAIRVIEWGQMERSVEIDAPAAGTLLWRVLAFPEMKIMVDGRDTQVGVDPATGLVACAIAAGHHRVEWRWQPFTALRWARRGSIGVALLLVLLVLWAVTTGRPQAAKSR